MTIPYKLSARQVLISILWGAASLDDVATVIGVSLGDKRERLAFLEACRESVPTFDRLLKDNARKAQGDKDVLCYNFSDSARNRYPQGTVGRGLWEFAAKEEGWIEGMRFFATIREAIQPLPAPDQLCKEVLEAFGNPWIPTNGGRSLMASRLGKSGPEYKLISSIPLSVKETCDDAWGNMPSPMDRISGSSETTPTSDVHVPCEPSVRDMATAHPVHYRPEDDPSIDEKLKGILEEDADPFP